MKIRSMSMIEPSTATSNACARSSARSILISTRSKPCMASDTDTANPDRKGRRGEAAADRARRARAHPEEPRRASWPLVSRLGRTIIALNLLGLAILIGGALIFNELRQGLVKASLDSLT